MPDFRECYVSANLEIGSTCFHICVTYYGCMFDRLSSLKNLQQFLNRGLLPILSSKCWMQLSTHICPPSSPLYEF